MSRYIDTADLKAELSTASVWTTLAVMEIADRISSDVVGCTECRFCKEQGGHTNCNGYLYCTRQKTLVDETCFCSWGKREGE